MAKKETPPVEVPKCPKCKKVLLACKCEDSELVKSYTEASFPYWK